MVETVLSVCFLCAVFFSLYALMRRATARVLMDYAAGRAARARAVGFNDFMCLKTARVAAIPVAGRRVWPPEGAMADEAARLPIYLCTAHEALARGVLEYEGWSSLTVAQTSSPGLAPSVFVLAGMDVEGARVTGRAEIEDHAAFYLEDVR